MTMDRLWAPWRVKYLRTQKQGKCIFCLNQRFKAKNYTVIRNRHSFAMLNKYPYNNGHILVAPLRHIKDLSQLKDFEIIDLFNTLGQVKGLLARVLKPSGFNIGINISETAGAGITGHLHIHIVPRWRGDTNFMPVIFNTKVVSQSLEDLYQRLRKEVACSPRKK